MSWGGGLLYHVWDSMGQKAQRTDTNTLAN